jgi:chemotaxis protein histidine kinase CheA
MSDSKKKTSSKKAPVKKAAAKKKAPAKKAPAKKAAAPKKKNVEPAVDAVAIHEALHLQELETIKINFVDATSEFKDFVSSTTDEIKDLVRKEAPARVGTLKRIFSKLFKR